MNERVVNVKNGKAVTLEIGPEERIFVAIFSTGFVEANTQEGLSSDEDVESRELVVGMLLAHGSLATLVGIALVAIAEGGFGAGIGVRMA